MSGEGAQCHHFSVGRFWRKLNIIYAILIAYQKLVNLLKWSSRNTFLATNKLLNRIAIVLSNACRLSLMCLSALVLDLRLVALKRGVSVGFKMLLLILKCCCRVRDVVVGL